MLWFMALWPDVEAFTELEASLLCGVSDESEIRKD